MRCFSAAGYRRFLIFGGNIWRGIFRDDNPEKYGRKAEPWTGFAECCRLDPLHSADHVPVSALLRGLILAGLKRICAKSSNDLTVLNRQSQDCAVKMPMFMAT